MFANNPIIEKYNEWNKSLLLNHPKLWALRLPTLLGYFVVFNLISIIFCFAFPLRTYHVTSMFTWLWLFGVVELIPLGFWLWKFSQFSPEKELERTSPVNGMLEILLYMLCIFIFLSPTLTSSAVLEYRFSRMVTFEEIEEDNQKTCGDTFSCYSMETGKLYSQDLVEKYTRLDYSTYKLLKTKDFNEFKQINKEMGRVIHKLINRSRGKFYEWNNYLLVLIILLHLSAFMFAGRHIRKGVFGKSIAFGVGIIIIMIIIQEIVYTFFYDYFGYSSGGMSTYEKIHYVIAISILVFTLFLSLRVFWEQKYNNFTALNITILPYVVYFELFTLFRFLESETVFWEDFQGKWLDFLEKVFGDFWAELIEFLIIGTPLLILPLYILIKAMYMRLRALPEG